ncbi:YaaC family protein [Ktedonospora formicarum]|uniref:Uncharacterized protein n=1 Tax=Ktedonospora formicarum TaxID=2778364 RepID=A0A8J3I5E0_9CHLR|nr:YaaC family protein [Ktedonospora formicarum]GHO48981.1 hypothetical protein KSX_71440 [Ktedonospora formicarum]
MQYATIDKCLKAGLIKQNQMNGLNMTQIAKPNARSFDGWMRLPISKHLVRQYTINDPAYDLWSALKYYSEVEEVGLHLIQTKGLQPQQLQQEIFDYFRAFIRQANSYYESAKLLHYRSSSLLYYYSFLNLVKAYLLLEDPQWIMGRTGHAVTHGLTYRPSTTNTDFLLEAVRVNEGIFPKFYEAQTNRPLSATETVTLNIKEMLGYPSDISSEYQLTGYGNFKIFSPLVAVVTDQSQNLAWTIIAIPAIADLDNFFNLQPKFLHTYQEIEINKQMLAQIFNKDVPELNYNFRFFQDITPIPLINNRTVPLAQLRQKIVDTLNPYIGTHYYNDNADFDLAFPYQDPVTSIWLPITEGLSIYVTMFYLSSLVRYRPNYLETLLNHKPAWLIENFVTNTPQVFLRIMVSKITGKEIIHLRR